ncbi:MAG TPA: HIT family protein [Kofleriaceae bacterium]|nr:HIT family protein [Kofleriaceae bacterium]
MRHVGRPEALARIAADRGDDCPLCRPPGAVIADNAHAYAMLARFAARPGHVVIALRRHAERIEALAWPEYEALHQLAWQVGRAVDRVFGARRVYIAALGSAEPLLTSFPHVHLHVVPLVDGGSADKPAAVFTWAHGMYVFDDAAEERALRDRLVASLPERA